MTHGGLFTVLGLLLTVVMLHGVATRLRLSLPILLVLVGLAVSLVPGLPHVVLEPDLVFLVFLPPLLYEAAWFTSWREFKTFRNAIALQALGLVLFTSAIVAAVAHAVIPGCTWALGFLLGGLVSPPDAVAATSVLKGIRVPRHAVAILEGESLVNDASSLIVVRFALAAVASGSFSLGAAVGQFFVVSLVGIAVGLFLAHTVFVLHRHLPRTPPVDAALTLLTPYVIYLAAEHAHASGVLAVVAGGLYLSSRSHRFLRGTSRVFTSGAWATAAFVLNGTVFILIGLQLREVTGELGAASVGQAILFGLLVSAVAIVVRLLWTFPAAYLPSLLTRGAEPRRYPSWRMVALIGWAGMRGVVSLASALAIPVHLDDGRAFPLRVLIVFVTFVVILVTLVFQGLSLPMVVKWLRFELPDDEHEQRRMLELELARLAVERAAQWGRAFPSDPLRFPDTDDERLRLELVRVQQRRLIALRNRGAVAHELARFEEFGLDLEIARLEERAGGSDGGDLDGAADLDPTRRA